jgi:dsDNA-binding SOS-regulon protein
MASIGQRAGRWQARVRRKGYPEEVNSFSTKAEAQKWARSIEAAMDQGTHQSIHAAKELLLADVLQRYMNEVTTSKRDAQREAEGIRFMLRSAARTRLTHPAPASAVFDFRQGYRHRP